METEFGLMEPSVSEAETEPVVVKTEPSVYIEDFMDTTACEVKTEVDFDYNDYNVDGKTDSHDNNSNDSNENDDQTRLDQLDIEEPTSGSCEKNIGTSSEIEENVKQNFSKIEETLSENTEEILTEKDLTDGTYCVKEMDSKNAINTEILQMDSKDSINNGNSSRICKKPVRKQSKPMLKQPKAKRRKTESSKANSKKVVQETIKKIKKNTKEKTKKKSAGRGIDKNSYDIDGMNDEVNSERSSSEEKERDHSGSDENWDSNLGKNMNMNKKRKKTNDKRVKNKKTSSEKAVKKDKNMEGKPKEKRKRKRDKTLITCKICNRQIQASCSMSKHQKTAICMAERTKAIIEKEDSENLEDTELDTLKEEALSARSPLECSVCEKKLASIATLRRHIYLVHNLDRPPIEHKVKCLEENCTKLFENKWTMRKHHNAVHLNIRKYLCDLCSVMFKTASALKVHLLAVHNCPVDGKLKKHECDVCKRLFNSRGKLMAHSTVHTNEKPYQCEVEGCGMWFRLRATMKKHVQTHHTCLKPFICETCGQAFSRKIYLETHQYKHTGVKMFKCTVCMKSFSQKGNLNIHMKQHDKVVLTFRCKFCDKSYLTKHSLYHHRRLQHDVHKPDPDYENNVKDEPEISVRRIENIDETIDKVENVTDNDDTIADGGEDVNDFNENITDQVESIPVFPIFIVQNS